MQCFWRVSSLLRKGRGGKLLQQTGKGSSDPEDLSFLSWFPSTQRGEGNCHIGPMEGSLDIWESELCVFSPEQEFPSAHHSVPNETFGRAGIVVIEQPQLRSLNTTTKNQNSSPSCGCKLMTVLWIAILCKVAKEKCKLTYSILLKSICKPSYNYFSASGFFSATFWTKNDNTPKIYTDKNALCFKNLLAKCAY